MRNETANNKHLMLFSGRAYPELAEEIAQTLETNLVPTRALAYANSEIYVRFEESVRGCDAFVIQSHTAPVNEWIMEQLIMVDALKRASAKRITVVAPFYPYARQDKKHLGREPISARLVADLYRAAGADRIMSSTSRQVLPCTSPTTSCTATVLAFSWSRRLWMIASGQPSSSVHMSASRTRPASGETTHICEAS